MKKSIKKNYIYNLVYQILVIVIPILTMPYLARVLGPSGTGTYSYTISIVTYFILFGSMGIALYGQREIAYNQNDIQKRSNIFFELFFTKIITLTISLVIFYLLFARSGEYSLYYKILILEIVANMLDISWFFQGIEEFKKIVIRNILMKIISVISIFLFVKSVNDVSTYMIIYVLTTFLSNLLLWIDIKKYIVKPQEINLKRHIKSILILFIPQIAIQIYTVLDKTMLGFILNDMSEVGYYEQAQKIVKMLLTIVSSLNAVMLPRISNFFINNDKKSIEEYTNKTFNFIFMIAIPMIFGIISVSKSFVPVFYGEGYEKVIPILCLSSIIILFLSISSTIGNQYLLPTKRQKEFSISVIVGCLVNLVLNILLIKNYLSLGACIATIAAEFIVATIQLYFVRKELNIRNILKISKNYLVAGTFMLICCLLVQNIFSNNILTLILQVIVGVVVYFTTLIIIKDDMTKYLINIVKSK